MRDFDQLVESTCGVCGRKLYTFHSKTRGAIFDCGGCGLRRFEDGRMQTLQMSDENRWLDVPEGTMFVRDER